MNSNWRFVGYLIEPVGVNDSKATKFATSTFLSNRSLAALEFELCHSLVCGFTIDNTLRNWPLASSTSHTHTVDNKPLKHKESTEVTQQTNTNAYKKVSQS